MEELKENLRKKGIETEYRCKGETTEKQGVSFSLGHHKFKGSEVDRNYSLNGLQKNLEKAKTQLLVSSRIVNGATMENPLSATSQLNSREAYLKTRKPTLLNTLLKPDTLSDEQPQSLLPKKRKKKKRKNL